MVVKKQAIKPVKSATSKTTRAQSTSRATQKRQIQKQIQKQNSISAPSKKQSKKKRVSINKWFYAIFTSIFVLNIAYIVQLKEKLHFFESRVKAHNEKSQELKLERKELYTQITDLKEQNIRLEAELKAYAKELKEAKASKIKSNIRSK